MDRDLNNAFLDVDFEDSKLSEDPTEDEKTKVETVDIFLEKGEFVDEDTINCNLDNVSSRTYKIV